MSKNKTKFFSLALASGLFFVVFLQNAWATGYQQNAEIPGQGGTTNDFLTYLQVLYNFAISISGILAIFMIAFGAFIYIVTSAGNSSKMADAKDMIYNAIIGLILVLVAYLIFFVVNPDLVRGVIGPVPTVYEDAYGGP